MKIEFDIKILRQHWINDDGKDNIDDLCSHGEVYLRIGNEELSNADKGSWTLSSTALYLMRSINENYEIGDYESQLVPCCGHCFIADESANGRVIILGCLNGLDWKIQHVGNGRIKHLLKNGVVGIIEKEAYHRLVLDFVNQVEKFYIDSKPKKKPKDESDRKGYEAFWREWRFLKYKLVDED